MSPKTLLSENSIFVSWGILVAAILAAIMLTRMSFQIDDLVDYKKNLVQWQKEIESQISKNTNDINRNLEQIRDLQKILP